MRRLAILETGAPPPALVERHGDYPAMFRTLLGAGYEFGVFRSPAGEWPDPAAFDAAIITGSAAGVYEAHPWIAEDERGFAARQRRLVQGLDASEHHLIFAHIYPFIREKAQKIPNRMGGIVGDDRCAVLVLAQEVRCLWNDAIAYRTAPVPVEQKAFRRLQCTPCLVDGMRSRLVKHELAFTPGTTQNEFSSK